MNYELNKTYHGFELIDKYPIEELDAIAYIFEHTHSGAKLLNLESDDDNKVFSAAFRTPPTDSTGVPHIVEHCVLSGSRKYKTKEPFMDMVKGSLKTFINAMTFSDKTIYPVASRNEKDFTNLMDVYLDSVFFPMLHETPEIFMQEGWHYDIHDKDEPITYKGVVYNEMRGAYSTPDSFLEDLIDEALYPNTCYSHSSGGNPDFIPDLTLEDFRAFHKKYYHPSNCYLFLYGNGDIDKYLQHMNEDYLCHFERQEIDSKISLQPPLTERVEKTAFYPVSEDESTENRDYLSLSYNLGLVTEPIEYLTGQILKHALVSSTAAPIKKALSDAELGEEVSAAATDGAHAGVSIILKNTSADKKDQFVDIIENAMRQLIENGIDKDLIRSSVNIVEYDMREASRFPTKGIIYHINSMQSWLYNDDPALYLKYSGLLETIRDLIETDHFEKFLEEKFLQNPHQALILLKPQPGLGDQKAEEVQKRLEAYKTQLSSKEIEKLIEDNAQLREKQLTPDSTEALATIPMLSVSDVEKDAENIPQTVEKQEEVTLLHHDIFSNDIAYVDYIFDLNHIALEDVPYVNLLTILLGKLDTEKHTYVDLTKEIYRYTGGVTVQSIVYSATDTDKTFYPKVAVRTKAIGKAIDVVNTLVNELLVETQFTDRKRLKDLLQEHKSKMEAGFQQNGHSIAGRRCQSYYSPIARYTEHLYGLDFYWFLSDLVQNFDVESDALSNKLQAISKAVFNRRELVISLTGSRQDYMRFKATLDSLYSGMNNTPYEKAEHNYNFKQINEGITTSGGVQYVSKASNYRNHGYDYSGSIHVLTTLLNSEYLHDRIRAKGGAYGCSISASQTGNMTVASYRDPNLTETLNVYAGAGDFIASLDLDQTTLDKYIIGTISKEDAAMTPHMKGRTATANYISGIDYDMLQQDRREILSTTVDDLRQYAELLKKTMQDNFVCVLGNDTTIKENADTFDVIVPLRK